MDRCYDDLLCHPHRNHPKEVRHHGMTDFDYPFGCNFHMVTDCGCPGYPTLQTTLRDCGNKCQERPRNNRCVRCQAADMIDRYQTRGDRYLERIIELQDHIEQATQWWEQWGQRWNTSDD